MKILAIDTSTAACSAALLINGKVQSVCEIIPRKHTERILPMIDQLLSEAGLSLNQLDALAFGVGPGAFTGVRLAAGIIQGLAYGADLPVVPVSTLAAMAQGAYRLYQKEHVLAALDAKMGEVYFGAYHVISSGILENILPDSVVKPLQLFLPSEGRWVGAGDGWRAYEDMGRSERITAVFPEIYPEAQDVVMIAQSRFQAGHSVSAMEVLPVYLRDQVV